MRSSADGTRISPALNPGHGVGFSGSAAGAPIVDLDCDLLAIRRQLQKLRFHDRIVGLLGKLPIFSRLLAQIVGIVHRPHTQEGPSRLAHYQPGPEAKSNLACANGAVRQQIGPQTRETSIFGGNLDRSDGQGGRMCCKNSTTRDKSATDSLRLIAREPAKQIPTMHLKRCFQKDQDRWPLSPDFAVSTLYRS